METKRELLIKEAIKRGYKKGTIIKSLYDSENYECSGLGCFGVEKVDIYYYNNNCDTLWVNNNKNRNILIYKEGKWAEIISYKEEIETPKHYDNSKGTLYKVATERGWNSYLFDIVKRLERAEKKGEFKTDLEKSINVIKLWLQEYEK